MTLEELLKPSQSSQTDEEVSSSEIDVELLLSSPQATITATKPIIKKRFRVISPPAKYTFKTAILAVLLQKMYSGVLGGYLFAYGKLEISPQKSYLCARNF